MPDLSELTELIAIGRTVRGGFDPVDHSLIPDRAEAEQHVHPCGDVRDEPLNLPRRDSPRLGSTRLETAARPYAEAAHIMPLGIPHNGPDKLENLLCLCPNCHVLFDGHALTVDSKRILRRLGISAGRPAVKAERRVNFDHISYHVETSQAVSESSSKPERAPRKRRIG